MPEGTQIIPVIPDEFISEESPWAEDLMGRFRDGLKWLHGAIAGLDTTVVLQEGTLDANPTQPTGSTSKFLDANPTDFTSFSNWSHLYVDGLFKGQEIEMTSGAQSGVRYRIIDHNRAGGPPAKTSTSEFELDGQMLTDGVLSGDGYKVLGHVHNTFDSEKLDLPASADSFIESGEVIMFNAACPTGFTRVTVYDNRIWKCSNSSGAGNNGGATTHTHNPTNTGGMESGGFRIQSNSDASFGFLNDANGQHFHIVSGASGSGNNERLEKGLFLCTKD